MLDKIYNFFIKIFGSFKNIVLHAFCIIGLIKLAGIHFGLIGLMLNHTNPEEVLQLLKTLITHTQLKIDTIYPILKKHTLSDIDLPLLITRLDKHIANTHRPPINSDILNIYIMAQKSSSKASNTDFQKQLQDREGAHESSITVSSISSLLKLLARYPNMENHSAVEEIMQSINPDSQEDSALINSALVLINSFPQKLSSVNLSLDQIVNLTWAANNDIKHSVWIENSDLEASEHDVSEANHRLRVQFYLNTLKKIALTTRIDDQDGSEQPLCFGGIYTELLETLDKIHIDVDLIYKPINTFFIQRMHELFIEHYNDLPYNKKQSFQTYPENQDTDITKWLEETHEKMLSRLNMEFVNMDQEKIRELSNIDILLYINVPDPDKATSLRL